VANFLIEKGIIKRGFSALAGLDEVGRGAIFGPVVAAAVIFPPALIRKGDDVDWMREINDSKLISPVKRKRLAKLILTFASSVGIGVVTNKEIDKKNIYWASLEAMKKAVKNLSIHPDFLLVDGFRLNDVNYPQKSIPKGDRKSNSIAAASIIAKVLRDEMMDNLDKIYKGYFLSKNKGYGTMDHYRALELIGPSSFHRFSFNLKAKK